MAAAEATISKVDAVREALKEGIESPGDGILFIHKRHGLEMTKQQFSINKSQIRKKDGKPARTTKAVKTLAVTKPVAKVAPVATGKTEIVDAIAGVKAQVDALGVDQVIQIAEMLRR